MVPILVIWLRRVTCERERFALFHLFRTSNPLCEIHPYKDTYPCHIPVPPNVTVSSYSNSLGDNTAYPRDTSTVGKLPDGGKIPKHDTSSARKAFTIEIIIFQLF